MLPQRLAINKFCSDIVSVVGLTDFVNRYDIRMVQRRCGFGFLGKSAKTVLVFCEFFREELKCDLTIEFGIFHKVDFSHATLTEFFYYSVMRDGLRGQCAPASER